jgi:hypothetical protein
MTRLREIGLTPAHRQAEVDGEAEEAVGRALAETPRVEDVDERRAREEWERHAREDATAADAMEMLDRARRRNGRMKLSSIEGSVQPPHRRGAAVAADGRSVMTVKGRSNDILTPRPGSIPLA